MKKDIAERLKEFPTLAKLTMLGDVVSAQAIEVFSRDAMLEIEGLRAALVWIRDELPLRDQDQNLEPHCAHARRLKQRAIEALTN